MKLSDYEVKRLINLATFIDDANVYDYQNYAHMARTFKKQAKTVLKLLGLNEIGY